VSVCFAQKAAPESLLSLEIARFVLHGVMPLGSVFCCQLACKDPSFLALTLLGVPAIAQCVCHPKLVCSFTCPLESFPVYSTNH